MTKQPTQDDAIGDLPTPSWMKALRHRFRELFDDTAHHFAEPHISAAQYSRARRLALGADVLDRTVIYLDQKYWIYCRDAMVGNPHKPIHATIWHGLKALVDDDKLVCPVAYPILAETLKQGDLEKRKQTAKVIDALSRGVAIQPFAELVRTELWHLLASAVKGAEAVHPLRELAWTYAGWVFGEVISQSPAFDDATNNAIQKGMFDIFAALPFSTLIEATAEAELPPLEDDDQYYAKLNAGAAQHQHEIPSFDVAFQNEVAGFLEIIQPEIISLRAHQFTTATGQPAPPSDSPEVVEAARVTRNLIYHAYRLKKWTTQFPALHIGSGIHAAVRHRRQPYKHGDHWDHLHAHAALGYCDAFLTERALGNLLSSPPLEYAAAYGCQVFWKDNEALDFVESLARKNQSG